MTVAASALSLIGFASGVIAFIVALARKSAVDRPPLVLGLVVCALVLGVVGMQIIQAASAPPIHDITTDFLDPPQFDAVVGIRLPSDNPLEYDTETLPALQQQAYPWVEPLTTPLSVAELFERAHQALESLGLEIVSANGTAGRIEATATTFWFGFKDDVVVRLRTRDGLTIVDVRSVSRVGVSDLGANARRVAQILDRLAD